MHAPRILPDILAEASRGEHGYRFVSANGEAVRSYAELHERALRLAHALRALGLRRGDLVALIVADHEQFLTSLFGASLAGVVPASLYPPAATSDLATYLESTTAVLQSCGARAVITSAGMLPHLDPLRAVCPALSIVAAYDMLDAPAGGDGAAAASDTDIAFVQFTSGSTSAPKGVVITHRNLLANIAAFCGPSGVGASASDVVTSWLPLYHDMGLVGMALGPVYSRSNAVLLTPQAFVKRPVEWLRAITRHRATVSFAPNFAYDLSVRRVKDKEMIGLDLSSWRVAGCGAEPIHASTLAAFAEKFRAVGFRETSFLPSYGLAEHVLAATMSPRGRRLTMESLSADDMTSRRVATRAERDDDGETITVVSCGFPLPGHQIRIVDDQRRPLPERHIGEIVLTGPSVSPGYYQDAEITARTMRDGRLFTGDLGYLSKGELFVCGRVKDLIIVNGRKYHPQDLEWGLADLAGIRRGRVVAFGTAATGRPDRTVVVAEPSGTVPPRELKDLIRRRIADVCGLLVDDIVLVPGGTVTRTTSGKVRRAATKTSYERGEFSGAAADSSGVQSGAQA
jgi:fatty-acyl-CoA synthase